MTALLAFEVCTCLWASWLIVWIIWAFQSKQTKQRESFASRMSYTLVAWLGMYLMFYGRNLGVWWHSPLVPYRPWVGVLGVALTVLGFAITFWARAILGGNWSSNVTIKVAHELVRTGPYHWVRHPIYTGMIVAMAGTAIARDQWRGVPAVVLLWVAFTIKRLKEERFMRQTFGDHYTAYSHATGAIFPSLLRRNP